MLKVLLAGATSYVGRRLKGRLLGDKNVSLRVLVRDARHVSESARGRAEIVEGDINDREVVKEALKAVDVVYYPIRLFGALWEPRGPDNAPARMFRDLCIEEGVKRLVYVGLHVADQPRVQLFRTMTETGKILGAHPEKLQTVWLRTGVLMGSGSVMFELLRNIVRKIPVIILSRWMQARMTPVSVDDLVEYLVRVKDLEVQGNLILDIGSEEISFQEMLKASARVMGLRRAFVPLPFTAHRLSSFLLMLATPFSFRLSSQLIKALQSGEIKPVSAVDSAAERYLPGVAALPFEKALEKAVEECENDQVQSRWVDTLEKVIHVSPEKDISRAVYTDVKSMSFGDLPPRKIFRAVKSIGGKEGWFTFDFLWRIRGFLDKLAGGYGTAMGKRTASDLRLGDMLDVWRVVDLREDRRLLLEAQMKVFGKAWLEFKIEGNTLTQIAYHCPNGILGRLYWYSMLPFHVVIFRDMIRSIIRQARDRE